MKSAEAPRRCVEKLVVLGLVAAVCGRKRQLRGGSLTNASVPWARAAGGEEGESQRTENTRKVREGSRWFASGHGGGATLAMGGVVVLSGRRKWAAEQRELLERVCEISGDG